MRKTDPIYTTVRLSTETYNKMHYLSQPFETHDETLKRILTEFPEMEKKVRMLEDMLITKGTK